MADQRSDSMQVSSCMGNSKEDGQLSGMLYHGKAHSNMGDDSYIRAVFWATLESPRAPNSLLLLCHLESLYSCHFVGLFEFHKGPSLGL